MKTQNIGFALFAMLCIVLSFAFSSDNPQSFGVTNSTSNSVVFIPTATTDTISGTERDTLTQSSLLSSKWTGRVQLSTTTVSGTNTVKVYVYETNTRAGGNWILVDSTGSASVSALDVAKVTEVYGLRRRYIIAGTGSGNRRYTFQEVYKKY